MKSKWKFAFYISLTLNLAIAYVGWKAYEYRSHINEFLEKYTYVVDEFSGRKEYQDANKSLPADKSLKGRVVFFGSQITSFWDLDKYFFEYQAVNRGISGQRVAGYLLRFRQDVIDLDPKAAVIEFSSYNFRPENDIDEIRDFIISMGQLARVNRIIPIFTTVIPVRSDFYVEGLGDYSVGDSLRVYNRWLRKFCDQNGYPLVDFYQLLADRNGNLPEDVSSGQILLNDKGYDVISAAVQKKLDSLEQ